MSVEKTGIVISLLAGFYDVETVDGVYRTRARGAFRNKAQKPVVGDQVKIKVDKDSGYLIEILPRTRLIGRPAVANVSNVVLVMSAVEPDFSLLLLDRFLAFFSWKKVPVTIYLSKTDLISENNFNELKKILDYYLQIGYPIFYSWQKLAKKFTKQISQKQIWTLAGQSGAGKSTLLNYITGRKEKTAAISRSLNRGKHTTRQVQLFTLQQGFLADTPGFSAIELSPIKITNLKNYFREFNLASQNCKFRGCQHLHEPGCEVKRQVASGEIRKSRYDNYLLLRQEIISGRIPEYLKK